MAKDNRRANQRAELEGNSIRALPEKIRATARSRGPNENPPEWWHQILPSLSVDSETPGVFGWDDGTRCRLKGWEEEYAILQHEDDQQGNRFSWLGEADPSDAMWSIATFETEHEARTDARKFRAEVENDQATDERIPEAGQHRDPPN